MICGRCWQAQTGGKPDGDPKINPHYRYGGLWKNHHQQISGKNKVPKPQSCEVVNSSTQSHDASFHEEEDRALEVKLQSSCR
ncbi:hypothetical protein DUNSADRAFT_14104 [Dunaliella salina]|uniref:Encoded protein n=1 Tax=Dunaliella salina TaxID=3046 RepID=A0ABQ7G805_DUNSA|nr:hypothetical protein DUNSADRAFT_14104 [Dunaliella salina]|eukprot:KAF5830743.1 hypothetical protein DUNSADRAFT_14104 [Dunaliella salina]